MRSADLHAGHAYLLARPRGRVVMILDTSPELRRGARVRVRFQNGVKAGTETDIPTVRVVSALTGPATQLPDRPTPAPRPGRVHRDPTVGETVAWAEKTASVLWTVEQVNADKAMITTKLMGMPQSAEVKLSELEVQEGAARTGSADLSAHPRQSSDSLNESPVQELESLAPEKPRRELDEIMDEVLLSPACLDVYRDRFAAGLHGAALVEAIREEVRGHGFLDVPAQAAQGEYGRVRVLHRFDLVLPSRPTPSQPVKVTTLAITAEPDRRGGRTKQTRASSESRSKARSRRRGRSRS